MIHPWLGIAGVLGALVGLFAALWVVKRWLGAPPELLRKLMHVGMGLVVLTFPWVFHQQWPVTLLVATAVIGLLFVRFVPRLRDGIGTILNSVQRPSLGEIYFPLSVGIVFWWSERDKLLYCVPMLIMILADATAALIGIAYGKVKYVTSEGLKSAEGSIAFFSIAFLSVHVPLLLYTDVGRTQTLLVAIIIGMLAMLLEAIAWRGLDNLLIPIGALLFLNLYLDASVDDLVLRLIVTIALLIFALSWRRRSSLDDSALMTAALFGYGAWMLGGPLWLVGPGVLFVVQVVMWPRTGERREHTVFATLSVVSAALLWLGLYVHDAQDLYLIAYAVTFGVHLAIMGVSRIELDWPITLKVRRLGVWVLAGAMLAVLQVIAFSFTHDARAHVPSLPVTGVSLVGVALGAGLFFVVRPSLYMRYRRLAIIHTAGFVTGIVGALVAMLLCALASGAV